MTTLPLCVLRTLRICGCLAIETASRISASCLFLAVGLATAAEQTPAIISDAERSSLAYSVKLETAIKHDDGQFLWFHPRLAAIPGNDGANPAAVMTIQKHLKVSDYYSGLHVMTRANLDAP